MQVGQLAVISVISFDMPGQKIQSLAFSWHLGTQVTLGSEGDAPLG